MNNNKLRRIILEELSRAPSSGPYHRAQKLGLMDYLGESSDRHLLELDDGTVISTGVNLNEEGLGGDFSIEDDGAAFDPAAGDDRPEIDTAEAEAPDAATVEPPSEPVTTAPDPATAEAPPVMPADAPPVEPPPGPPTTAPAPDADEPADSDDGSGRPPDDGLDSGGVADSDIPTSAEDSEGPGDSDPAPEPPDDDLDPDTLNADVIDYIDNISTNGAPAGTSESRSRPIGTSLLKLLYHD